MQKNTVGKWTVFAFQDEGGANPGEPVTGDAANITANVRIDAGAANAVDDTNPTEMEDGYYTFDITAVENNGDLIMIAPVSSTANVNVIGVPGAVWTTPANFNDLSIVVTTGLIDITQTAADKVWSTAARLLTAGTNIVLAKGVGVTGFNDLSVAQINIEAVGYAGPRGPGVYLNDAAANTNVVDGVDGVIGNPVSTIAAAKTLADSMSYDRIYFLNDADITLAATMIDYEFVGIGELMANVVNLGSQDVSASAFYNLTIEGVQGGAGRIYAEVCALQDPGAGATTLHIFAKDCGIADEIEIDTSNDNVFDHWYSLVAGTATPKIIATGVAGTLTMRHGSGGIELSTLSASHNVSIETDGQVIFTSDCNVNATVALRGNLTITDNTAGMNSLSIEAALSRVEIAKANWDRVLTAANHNITSSAGRRLRNVSGGVIRNDTAQGPGTGNNQIQFDTGASAVDGAYDPALVIIVGGTGTGQTRLIYQYDGTTKTATVDRNWKVNPDVTSEFVIFGHPGREHVNEGLAQAGASTTITLNVLASANNNAYVGQTCLIRSGTGEDQARLVNAYDGTTKIATVSKAWDVTPDTTSGYVMLPTALLVNGDIAEAVWDALTATYNASGSFGEFLQALPSAAAITTAVWAAGTRTLTAFSTTLALSVWHVLLSSISTASTIGLLLKQLLQISEAAIETGTASGTPTTTAMISDIILDANDQFKGRILTFDSDTTTTNLQGQQTDITGGVASTNTINMTALTTAPVSGDTFTIT